jgi:hypothetical protein
MFDEGQGEVERVKGKGWPEGNSETNSMIETTKTSEKSEIFPSGGGWT